MGVYHQGGVVPAQIWIGQQQGLGVRDVFWWKTYSPPVWLLGGNETAMGTAIATRDLMGMDMDSMAGRVMDSVGQCVDGQSDSVCSVAPCSSTSLEVWMRDSESEFTFEKIWTTRSHLNLDDIDVKDDGIWGTLRRVVGRRGLSVWRITRKCA